MTRSFVEPLVPLGGFDPARMAWGEPGTPLAVRWRKTDYHLQSVLDSARDFGDCIHGSGKRYVRRHVYRVPTQEGPIFRIRFSVPSASRGLRSNDGGFIP